MPNHITTKIKVIAPDEEYELAEKFLDSMETEESAFDFRKAIPEPENIEKGNCGMTHEPGVICWYEWRSKNWGTKWGAYDIKRDQYGDEVKFETAWAHPIKVITALSKSNPKLTFFVVYADEDTGHNLGGYIMQAGEKKYEMEIKEGSNMAELFAFAVQGCDDPKGDRRADEIVENFYSRAPKYRTKESLKELINRKIADL